MEKGKSSLNPSAASYVPVSKRGTDDESKDVSSAQESQGGNEAHWYGHQPDYTLVQGQHQNVSQSYVGGASAFQTAESHYSGGLSDSSSHNANVIPQNSNLDEYDDAALAYLEMEFPTVSNETIYDVYLASGCDLDVACNMLDQAEWLPNTSATSNVPGSEPSQSQELPLPLLPDTLGIGDEPGSEPSPSQELPLPFLPDTLGIGDEPGSEPSPSQELKNTTPKAGASISGPSKFLPTS